MGAGAQGGAFTLRAHEGPLGGQRARLCPPPGLRTTQSQQVSQGLPAAPPPATRLVTTLEGKVRSVRKLSIPHLSLHRGPTRNPAGGPPTGALLAGCGAAARRVGSGWESAPTPKTRAERYWRQLEEATGWVSAREWVYVLCRY